MKLSRAPHRHIGTVLFALLAIPLLTGANGGGCSDDDVPIGSDDTTGEGGGGVGGGNTGGDTGSTTTTAQGGAGQGGDATTTSSTITTTSTTTTTSTGGTGGEGTAGTGGAGATGGGGGGSGDLEWYFTCGDPVCKGYTPQPGVPLCTDEKPGNPCAEAGKTCDPVDDCNRLLVCDDEDPTQQPGGCPISLAETKRDIRYLDEEELRRVADELLAMKLATWHYKAEREGTREHLGFIIDDAPESRAVASTGTKVDLYGFASMAAATVQVQARRIDALERELSALRHELRGGLGASAADGALCGDRPGGR